MTGVFAISFLVLSRLFYKKPGMQMGMGLVAGGLRLFNPFVGCHVCSALAIMAEGMLFEIIWYSFSNNFDDFKNLTMQSSVGIFTAYIVYVGGYIVTQVSTPIVTGVGFHLENLIVFMPRILASGILAALLGGMMLPITFKVKDLDISIKDKLYYPATIGTSAFCWIFVVGLWYTGA